MLASTRTIRRILVQHTALIGVAVLALVLAALLFRHVSAGLVLSRDSNVFIRWSSLLIATEFDIFGWVRRMGLPEGLYAVPMTVMALFRVWFAEGWQLAFFAFNLVCAALTVIAISSTARLLDVSWLAIAAVLPLVLLSADFMYWPHYLLTDSFFTCLVMIAVWWSVFVLTRVDATWQHRLLHVSVIVLLLGLLLFTRPTAPTYVAAFAVFFMALLVSLDRRSPPFLLMVLAGACVALAVGYGLLMFSYVDSGWPERSPQLNFLASYAVQGVIVHDRPETFITHAGDWSGFAQVYLLRFVTFWSPYASSFSTAHLLANTAITLVFAAAALAWLVTGRSLSRAAARAVLLCLLLAFAGAAFHGLLFIDYDWRYRFPVIAPLLLVVMVMLNHIGQRLLPPRWRGVPSAS